jgi:hypothetical protein
LSVRADDNPEFEQKPFEWVGDRAKIVRKFRQLFEK